jgi:hypothetical protein
MLAVEMTEAHLVMKGVTVLVAIVAKTKIDPVSVDLLWKVCEKYNVL